ncbi:uncharacterized protein LOC100899432 isoform X2 [Galendromus occidentalis]|uniref:Uncharacterized protein LOC100899432 isoform X2 n=1 Tax=Galendromus occidentalis TaxID=34638 RepID=A0AAJ7L7C5_9ACAR|nr:uncharacterized protein LOC100899432 isoform X2 [Galendromus occidentalis]
MKLVLSVILFSFLWGAHHCSPRRIFMLSFPRTGVRSHLAHLTMPDRNAEKERPSAATKRNIAAMARDNQIPVTKRFEEDVIFEDDGEFFLQKRDYGEELGTDAAYDDPRDKNDRKICSFIL